MVKLRLNQIRANPWNCNFLSPQERANLKQRMKEDGQEKTLPVVVRKITEAYELIDGQQRWELADELGWETMDAIEREADDLQTKVLCVSYNRWRGRLNWFKLYDVMKKDLELGVDIYASYKGSLSSHEVEGVLSLGNLIPEARALLEESLKKYPEITLEQLHLLSLFPSSQQGSLVEKFKTPVVIQALTQALNPFLPKNQSQWDRQSFDKAPKDTESYKGSNFPRNLKQLDVPGGNEQDDLRAVESGMAKLERKNLARQGLLVEVSYDCDCGRHYRVNFKNMSVIVQKANLLFEHVNFKPVTFQVHCDKCNSEHEFSIDGIESEIKILCRRCKPLPRKGILDVNTGEVRWLD